MIEETNTDAASQRPDSDPQLERRLVLKVEDPEKIWDLIKDGTSSLKSHSSGFVKAGPTIGNVGGEPELKYVGDVLTFKVDLLKDGKPYYGDLPADELKDVLSTNPSYIPEGVNIFRKPFINGLRKRVATRVGSDFIYTSGKGEIQTASDLQHSIEEAILLFETYSRAIYKNAGEELPEDEIIIRPDELENMEEVRTYRDKPAENGSSIENLIIREKPNVRFEDIGGQDKAVETCKRFAEQLRFPDVYKLQGSDPPRGILLYGPQGTGKTMLAKAIANNSDANFLFVQAGDVVGEGLYGQTERLVSSMFSEAKRLAETENRQTIIFVDEADLILPQGGAGSVGRHEATGRVVGIFAQEMDGVKSSNKITVILATNDVEKVDPKILSRMDEREEVPLPNAKGLEEILRIQLRLVEEKFNIKLTREGIDLLEIGQIAMQQKLSGRDMKDVLGNLNRRRGQLQLRIILDAVSGQRIPLPQGADVGAVVKNITERIKSGDTTGIEDLQLPPITQQELVEAFNNGKALVEQKRSAMGFDRKKLR